MRAFPTNFGAAVFGLTLWWWLAGPGGFESAKLGWLAACLAGSVLYVVWRLAVLPGSAITWRAPRTTGTILLFLLYASLRAVWSPDPTVAWVGTTNYPVGVAGWWVIGLLAIMTLQLPDRHRRIKTGVWIATGGVLLWTIGQRFGLTGTEWTTFDDPQRGRDLFGSIGSPGQLGVITALLALLLLPDHPRRPASAVTWINYGGALVLAGLTWITRSLSGEIIMLIGIWLWAAPSFRRVTVITLVLAWLGGSAALMNSAELRHRVAERAPSLADRAAIWQAAGEGWRDRPWWGWGPQHFQAAFDHHYPPERLNARAVTEEKAHSLFWEVLTELGLAGILLTAGILMAARQELRLPPSLLPATVGWILAALLNPVLLASWSVALLILLAATVKVRPREIRLTTPVQVTAGIVISTAVGMVGWTGYQAVQRTQRLDRARLRSAELEFMTAANLLRPSTAGWAATPDLRLARAEALTNHALKYDEWYDYGEVKQLLDPLSDSPFFTTSLIAWRLHSYWAQHVPAAAAVNERREKEIAARWSSHPRYAELRPDATD